MCSLLKSMPNHVLAVVFSLLGNDCIILRECTCTIMVYYMFISLIVVYSFVVVFRSWFGFIFIELKNIHKHKVFFISVCLSRLYFVFVFVFVMFCIAASFHTGKFWDGRICWWFKITFQTTFYLAAKICLPCHKRTLCSIYWSLPGIGPM